MIPYDSAHIADCISLVGGKRRCIVAEMHFCAQSTIADFLRTVSHDASEMSGLGIRSKIGLAVIVASAELGIGTAENAAEGVRGAGSRPHIAVDGNLSVVITVVGKHCINAEVTDHAAAGSPHIAVGTVCVSIAGIGEMTVHSDRAVVDAVLDVDSVGRLSGE